MVNVFTLAAAVLAKHGSQAERTRTISAASEAGQKLTVTLSSPPAGFEDVDLVLAAEHGIKCKSGAAFGNGIATKSATDVVGGDVATSFVSMLSMNEAELAKAVKADAVLSEVVAELESVKA
jgi:hypothetical protein